MSKIRITRIPSEKADDILRVSARYRELKSEIEDILSDGDWRIRYFGLLDVRGEDDCWEWQGHRQQSGHGRFQTSRFEKSGAHQIAWLLFRGPIAAGSEVCHKCDNPPCCNPKHLWLGTRSENQRDSWNKGRRAWPVGHHQRMRKARGEANAKAKLTEVEVAEILKSPLSNVALAAKYAVNDRSISAIRAGKTWRHVERPIFEKERDD